jgi:hypothetical protein
MVLMRIFLDLTCLSCCFCNNTENQYEENFKQISNKASELLSLNRMREVAIKKQKEYDKERKEKFVKSAIKLFYFSLAVSGGIYLYLFFKKFWSPVPPKSVELSNPKDSLTDVDNQSAPAPGPSKPGKVIKKPYEPIKDDQEYPFVENILDVDKIIKLVTTATNTNNRRS